MGAKQTISSILCRYRFVSLSNRIDKSRISTTAEFFVEITFEREKKCESTFSLKKFTTWQKKKNKTKKFPTDKIKNFLLVSSPIFEIIFKKSFAAAVERKKRKRKNKYFSPHQKLVTCCFFIFCINNPSEDDASLIISAVERKKKKKQTQPTKSDFLTLRRGGINKK